MKRNEKEERSKYLRRLDKKSKTLAGKWSWRGENLIWVPVEEPQFLGWEVKVVLGEAGLRRGDVDNLLAVMDYFNMSRVTFTRYGWVDKLIRTMHGRYEEVTKIVLKHVRRRSFKGKWGWTWCTEQEMVAKYIPYHYDNKMTQQVFDTVPAHLKGYFAKYEERATYWRPAYYYYKLSDKFPRYELRFKVSKAYSTHRGIPKSDEISESAWIEKQLENNHYYDKQDHSSYEAYWHKRTNRTARKHWKAATKQIASRYDGVEELVEQQERYVLGRAIARKGWC